MNTSDALEKLIRACVDDKQTLQHESTFVDARRAETLTKLARERERFVNQLEKFGGGVPGGSHGSWAELLREGARDVWVTASGRNNGDAIAVCRHSRARTEACYEEAMQLPWPDDIGLALAEQRGLLHEEAQELNYLQF